MRPSLLIITLFTVFYLCFPTHNSSVDAWFYAASVHHHKDLFLPHHLLHNAFQWVVVAICPLDWDTLAIMKGVNAIAGGVALLIFYALLSASNLPAHKIPYAVALVGMSFVFWRFTTENETYILPACFSLAAILFWRYYQQNPERIRWLFLSSLSASIGALFHQIYICTWIGIGVILAILFLQKRLPLRALASFGVVGCVMPMVYAGIWMWVYQQPFAIVGIWKFALTDFYSGAADPQLTLMHFVLTPINFIRVFIQLHGNIRTLCATPMGMLPILAWGVVGIVWLMQKNTLYFRRKPLVASPFSNSLWVILFLYLAVAFFSQGNAEFMVMIAFICTYGIFYMWEISPIILQTALPALFLWNFSYGIFPYYKNDFQQDKALIQHIQQHPEALYLLQHRPLIENKIYYFTGNPTSPQLLHTPLHWEQKGLALDSLHTRIQTQLNKGNPVFTDAPATSTEWSRASLLEHKQQSAFWQQYRLIPLKNHLWQVMK